MSSFGFDANGTYLIDIDIPQRTQTEFQIAILNKKQYISYFFRFFPPSVCDLTDVTKYTLNSNNHTLQGTFPERIEIYPFLLRCYQIRDTYELPIITEYHNPSTYLDNRMVNGIYCELTIFLLYIIMNIAWFSNWIRSKQKLNLIQYIITATIVLFTISHIARYFELKKLDKTDYTKSLTNFRIVFNFLTTTFCCFFFLLGSEGVCILSDNFEKNRILAFFIVSSLFSGCLFLTFFLDLSENYSKIVFLDLFCFFFYGYELFEAMNRANAQIETLLVSQTNEGTSLKNKQYKLFQRIFIVVLCCVFFCLVFSHFSFLLKNWIVKLFVSLIEISVVGVTAFVFRPIKKVLSLIDSPEIENRLIVDDGDDSYSVDDDEIHLNSIESTSNYLRNGPTPDQPLLQQEQQTSEKKTNGNKFSFL